MSSDAQASRGVGLAANSGTSLEGIVGQVAKHNDAVAGIARHAFEQANAPGEVDAALTGVDKAMERTAGLVDTSAVAAQTPAEEIGVLQDTISSFPVDSGSVASRRAAE